MITPSLMLSLLLILTVAWALGYVFTRFGLPIMLGELMAGVLLGPPVLALVTGSPPLELMADFGIFFVMFYAGMELDPKILLRHVWPSIGVAVGGFVLPFVLGTGTTLIFGGTVFQSLFVGMGVSITAIAVGSVILRSMRINTSALGHVIIGAAIVDDILSLIGLSVLLSLARHGALDFLELFLILAKVVGFFGLTFLVGHFVMPRLTRRLTDQAAKGFTFAIITALVMAYLAELAGLHMIIGAFLAGQFVRKEIMDEEIYERVADRFYGIAYGFLVPIFFVSLSFHLHIDFTWHFWGFSLALIAAAVLGKVIGSGLAARMFGHSSRESLVVGFGMNGRGAVELVVASVVLELSRQLMAKGVISAPLLTQGQFSALILMAFVTTLMAPLTLKWSVVRTCLPDEKAAFCSLLEDHSRA